MRFGLPRLPNEAEIAAQIPAILPVRSGEDRPFWSVMLPTYESDAYLGRALASVLEQDAGPAAMQIEVIDDGSRTGDPEGVVQRLGGGRVGFHRHAHNRGATQTFNSCLQRSRGFWVHILHADDEVRPGFYAAYERIIASRDDYVMVVGPVTRVDADGEPLDARGGEPRMRDGVFEDFAIRQATRQQVPFAGWVLRREACERAGGFCTFFQHCADWELAFRLGLAGPVGRVTQPYALRCKHAGSDTRRLMLTGENIREATLAIQLNLRRLARARRRVGDRDWRKRLARDAGRSARRLAAAGSTQGELAQAAWAFRLRPTPRRARAAARAWLSCVRARLDSGPRPGSPGGGRSV